VITHGKIIRSSPARSGNYDILIGFTAKDNKQYSFTSEIPSQIALHSINYVEGASNVKVAYNPQDPGAAPKNASDKSTPVFGTLFEILGGVFAVIGLISTIQQLFTRR
jgi:hypothetical protein